MRLAAMFRDISIRRKLTLISVLSAGAALLLVAILSTLHQWYLSRADLEQATHSQASIVATNSTSALVFNDPQSASQTLEALQDFGNIEFAVLYDKQGKFFAMFVPVVNKPQQPDELPQEERHIFTATYLEVFHPIFFEGERVGTLHVRSSLVPIYQQMAWSVAVIVASSLGGLALVLVLIAYLHPAITDPMVRLAGLMDEISREKNYGLRAEVLGKDELGALAQGLNDMLVQIQMRDDALAQHRQHLEEEVAIRTAELGESNTRLEKELEERKAAEQELKGANEQLSVLLGSLPLAVYRCRAEGNYAVTYMSHNVVSFTGYKAGDFIEQTDLWLKRIHPDDASRIGTEMAILFEKGKHAYEYRWQNADGSYRWILDSLRLMRSEDGTPGYMVGMWQDITERKLAEQELEESERKFRAILDSAVDGVLVADGQTHKFVTANLAICDMLGYQPEEIYQLVLEDIHPAEALPEVQHQFERQMKGEIRVAQNLPVKRKDGSVFFADISSSPMFLSGQPFLVGVFHDVTERRQAEEKIRKVNEELEEKVQERTNQLLQAQDELLRKEKLAVLGQVAGSVGHELRNPLGVMNNAVYFLQTVLSEADETIQEYLNIIKEEIAGSERIVSDLLDAVRTKPPHQEAVGLREVIGQTLGKLTIPPSVSVKLDIPETLPALRVDAMQIHQVFRNLISNGVEAMPEGGTLEIRAVENRQEETVTVSVRDSGTGIAPEVLAKLFQPLFTTKARGIGLGLVVVKNLTQANGGTVDVQSEPGKGTTFTITLPSAGLAAETAARMPE